MPLETTKLDLHGHFENAEIHLTYTTFHHTPPAAGTVDTTLVPRDTLQVVHGQLDQTFSGDQIMSADTGMGQFVAVKLFTVPDLGITSIGFFLPDVAEQLPEGHAHITTLGVQSLKSMPFSPQTQSGQIRSYRHFQLTGSLDRSPVGAGAG